ncbi:unnamed protein product [Adineta ricciae]|uniref:Uncharacterized protein n=2 Tax=Adineta ricciae TaxID=249248 RepID=A0A815ZYF4_ADIRI|nr:unnamed protein product [Adineta ricciae]
MYIFLLLTTFLQLESIRSKGKYDFGPNQLASNVWYRPKGQLINGHYEHSYSNFTLWPKLRQHLIKNNGSISIQASEIGYMTNDMLMAFRRQNLSIIVVSPAFTQCYDGTSLGLLEFYGQSPSKDNLFCQIFQICDPIDRQDPNGKGWFVTKDGFSFTPDLLNFDERMPNLVSYLDYDKLINRTVNPVEWYFPSRSWNDRKAFARIDPCPQAGSNRTANLMSDYVKYISIMNQKFNSTKIPQIQINWNVIEGWEWRDESCLDLLYAKYPNASDFDHAYRYVTDPCHHDSQYLQKLVDLLCSVNACPQVVYMDVDLTYITSYSVDVLRLNKQILNKLNISFGINLVDQCVEFDNCVAEILSSQVVLNLDAHSKYPNLTRNQMQEFSLKNVLNFLINQTVVDKDTHIAITSWTTWPMEINEDIVESTAGGMAHTANEIFEQILIPNSFAN